MTRYSGLSDEEQKFADFLLELRHSPVEFVKVMFPWGEGVLEGFDGPVDWQLKVLEEAGNVRPDRVCQVAVASGHGIGKSALTAWLTLWAISTFPETRGVITANTENQLKTKTFAELSRWFHMSPLPTLFTLTATSLHFKEPEIGQRWRVDIVPWSERNTDAFQGLHNRGRREFMIFDEASGIDDRIYEAAQGFMSDADTERLWFLFGNPTRNTGFFRECFPPDGKFSAYWKTFQVDSREIPFTDKTLIESWAKAYGEDSDWFRVRVRGEFPAGNALEFIPRQLIRESVNREIPEGQDGFPLVMGVDVARAGTNDTVVFLRQGLNGRLGLWRWNGADIAETTDRVARLISKFQPAMVFIDAGGVGGGVVDGLRRMGFNNAIGVDFGGRPIGLQPGVQPLNRRVEMWFEMREWLKNGGCLPKDQFLEEELGAVYQKLSDANQSRMADKIVLEPKSEVEKRIGRSPDAADALALTFAMPVQSVGTGLRGKVVRDYNPLGNRLIEQLRGRNEYGF